MEFLRSFLRRHFAGKPVVASRNVGCFLRLRFVDTITLPAKHSLTTVETQGCVPLAAEGIGCGREICDQTTTTLSESKPTKI